MSSEAVQHRLESGRLHPLHRGVYAVGRPEVSEHGRWMAAVLACGPEALLSHRSAAALWRIRPERPGPMEVTVPTRLPRRRAPLRVHRRADLEGRRRPMPETQRHVTGHRVDFFWRELGLVAEADSLRYHRSTFKQSADMKRDHAHVSAGRTTLRFSHSQIRYEPAYVAEVLARNIARLRRHD